MMEQPQQVQARSDLGPDEDELDLLALAGSLWGGSNIIAGVTAAAIAAGAFYAYTLPPIYQADALLQLEDRAGGALALPEELVGLSGDSPRSVTEIEILKSRMVLGAAVADLRLDWSVAPAKAPLIGELLANYGLPTPDWDALQPYPRPSERLRLDLLEVPANWLGEPLILTVGSGDDFTLTTPDGAELEGSVGQSLTDAGMGLSVRIGAIDAPAGRQFVLTQNSRDAAIKALRDAVEVSELGRSSGILRVTMTGREPEAARRALDAVSRAYLSQNSERSAAEAESGLEFIDSQLPGAREAVRLAEAALSDAQSARGAEQLGLEGSSLFTQVMGVEQELRELEAREADLAQLYTRSHPEYRQLLEARARLQERLAGLREEVAALPVVERELLNLQRDLDIAQEIYLQLRNRAQELQVLRASNIGNVRVIDTATAGVTPVEPRKSRILLLAALLGIVLGAGLVWLRARLRDTITGAEAIEALGLPVFATLNKTGFMPQASKGLERLPLLAVEQPGDLVTEGLRSLRTSLHFGMLDAKTRSIALTSPAPNVGKSFICANLAVVAAQAGQRVCLIDADMRRGTQRKYFGTSRDARGLSDVLAGDVAAGDALVETSTDGLSFLPSGKFPPNPSELLMRAELSRLIEELDGQFDLTIIDCPPVLAVTDPVIVGRSAGVTVAVARFDETRPQELEATMQSLKNAGVPLAGAIFNAYDPKAQASRYGRRYGYSYAYNYRYDYRSTK
jgi:tyrosine-protein kinase Etk/Wzc